MKPQIRLWSIEGGKLVELNKRSFENNYKEKDLESWVEHNPTILGRELAVIGRQVPIPTVGILDLLAVDEDGRLVVIEFKRQQTTRETVAQVLDYAASLHSMTPEAVRSLTNIDIAKTSTLVDANPVLIIVAADADASVDRIVDYLLKEARLPLEVVTFTYATTSSGTEIIARSVATPDPLPESARSKNPAKITLVRLTAVAEERGVQGIFNTLHQVVALGLFPEMFSRNGGQIRYWVELPANKWRVIFGMYVGGDKFGSPKGQLDVWIRLETVSELTNLSIEAAKGLLSQFPLHHETDTTMVFRIGSVETASKLYELFAERGGKAASGDVEP